MVIVILLLIFLYGYFYSCIVCKKREITILDILVL